MKYIVAIIQPGKVEAVYNALLELGVSGLTTSEVHGYGRQKGKTEMYRGAEYVVNFIPKMKIEVAVSSKMADQVVAAIKSASESGKIGDGKIFTLDLADAMRIRTGETGAHSRAHAPARGSTRMKLRERYPSRSITFSTSRRTALRADSQGSCRP